ncbi:MAG: hypothetical protein NTU60_11200 [Candidatus Aminicenantes bacterium]|nr:hypothetical protein [Candidatus Aminicenantes bacterium]
MERKKMKRVNIILESELYDRARTVAFVKRKSLSEIVRNALKQWLAINVDPKVELLLSETEENKLLKILESEEFVASDKAKKSLGL